MSAGLGDMLRQLTKELRTNALLYFDQNGSSQVDIQDHILAFSLHLSAAEIKLVAIELELFARLLDSIAREMTTCITVVRGCR